MLSACGGDPCAEYVELLCDCVDEDAACDELKTTYEDADADLQDQCSAELDKAEAASEECQADESEE
tara:strand:+ start:285 stop:485 length:201 start_codon:yes stop_codon:yes gene_type:complete